jgi:hypothetical protein
MRTVLSELHLNQFTVLNLDDEPNEKYKLFRIDGREYKPVPIHVLPNCIAIESPDSFVGKEVEFVY